MALRRKSMYGLEMELITLDSEGKLVNGAPAILKAVEGKNISRYVRKEISQSLVELGAKEKRTVKESAAAFLEVIQDTIEIAEQLGYHLLPLGTHPGRQLPKLHRTEWYDAKKAVLGENTYKEGRICGFHFHYTLPEGIVEKDTKTIKSVGRSKARDIFLQQYNFLVAVDPAMLTFCQSTPFWMGVNWAKDCRVLVYRDFKVTKGGESFEGIHYYLPMFGALPNYEFTLQDIRVMADTKKAEWLRMLEQKKFPTNEIACVPSLKFMWGPLRVNKIGTFEYRGPDMNHPEVVFSTSDLLVHLLSMIEKKQIHVEPSDIGVSEPFLYEDGTIYVPPHTTLKYLEQQSVVHGFDSTDIHAYCSRLLSLVEKIPGKKPKYLDRIKKMVKEKKSVSDDILDMVKKNGYKTDEEVPEDMLDHIALYHAKKISSDITDLRKRFAL